MSHFCNFYPSPFYDFFIARLLFYYCVVLLLPAIIFRTLRDACKMESFDLGPLTLAEDIAYTGEGMKACHDYGRTLGENWFFEVC